jgi:DNA-binding MarR family transcriptional regulator
MSKTLKHKALVMQLFRIIKKCIVLEKHNIVQFKGVSLYPSEIHLLLFLHQKQDSHVTHIAERLGMTKGAVSQTLSRLEKKQVLRKIKNPYHNNELSVVFTALGQRVIEHVQRLHHSAGLQHDQYFSALTDSDRQAIRHFLAHLERTLDGI